MSETGKHLESTNASPRIGHFVIIKACSGHDTLLCSADVTLRSLTRLLLVAGKFTFDPSRLPPSPPPCPGGVGAWPDIKAEIRREYTSLVKYLLRVVIYIKDIGAARH